MARYVARIAQKSSFERWKELESSSTEKTRLNYNYSYFIADDDENAEKAIRKRFENYKVFNQRILSLEFKRVSERQWLIGPFNAKILSDIYYPTFDELEDWEDRQLFLLPIEKKMFTLRITEIDENGWKYIPYHTRFKAFSLQEAIRKVKKVYSGIDLKNNSIDDSPSDQKIASLEIKSSNRAWFSIFDRGIPERPSGQASANLHGKPEQGVVFYGLGVLAKWGRRIAKEKECFPALRRDIWDLTDNLENTIK